MLCAAAHPVNVRHEPLIDNGGCAISNPENLRDVHKIKKIVDDINSMEAFALVFPVLKPILSKLGVDTSTVEQAFEDLQSISEKARELASVPDRFNDLLADRGWILFERMNMEIAKTALAFAEADDFEAAESFLVEYFDADFVQRELKTMMALESFKPRMDLAMKALEDYRAERFHASVPVVLSLIDGLVSDLHEMQRGFFAEEADMQAWDSLAAHSKGLNRLSAIFRKGRRKTTTEPITVPYRHGILHGRDLGYANKIVAAKSWAALFAVREWAIKAERGELEPPTPEPEKGLIETLASIAESGRETERWKKWVPRELDWKDLEYNPDPSLFEDSTPEKALAEFLHWWMKGNYGYMSKLIPSIFCKYAEEEPLPLRIRNEFSNRTLEKYLFKNINHSVPSIALIDVELNWISEDSEKLQLVTFRLICEDQDGDFVAHGNPRARWGVMNWNGLGLKG